MASSLEERSNASSLGLLYKKDSQPAKSEAKAEVLEESLKKRSIHGRKWNEHDVINGVYILTMHVLALFAPFCFSWTVFWLSVGMYLVCGLLGITLCYHRCLAHRGFQLPKWLEYLFALFGMFAGQRDPLFWVSTHRYHHQFVDSEKDPHSPLEGFWFSHMFWLFDNQYQMDKLQGKVTNVKDLESQAFYRFLRDYIYIHPLLEIAVLYTLGGFPFIVWGLGLASVWGYHVTFMVNSVCHIWGHQAWNTGDLSRNNWLVAILTFGEGWHNNHHAFEYSARHGLEWWELDFTWYVIKFLQDLGLATHVKVPNAHQKRKMALDN